MILVGLKASINSNINSVFRMSYAYVWIKEKIRAIEAVDEWSVVILQMVPIPQFAAVICIVPLILQPNGKIVVVLEVVGVSLSLCFS